MGLEKGKGEGNMKITYIGHSGFLAELEKTVAF